MKVKSDHRSRFSNLSNWKEETWKISGLQQDLNPLPVVEFIILLCNEMMRNIFEIHILYCACWWKWRVIIAIKFPIKAIGRKKPEKYEGFNRIRTYDLCDIPVGSGIHHYRGGHGFESHWSPQIFFRLLPSSCLNWKIYCNDHYSLSN